MAARSRKAKTTSNRQALLVLNRSAGTGHAENDAGRIASTLRDGHGPGLDVDVSVVDGHPAARAAVASFCADASSPALVVVGGGGGTLRAAVEGVMEGRDQPPGSNELCLGSLRMGSGNVLARRLGMPLDAAAAAGAIGEGFRRARTKPCAVMRCTTGGENGAPAVLYAITMCGLGAWGRVPGDIARWRMRHAEGRRRAAAGFGLERVNGLEYLAFGARRMLAAAVSASRCEVVEVDGGRTLRLLAAVALTVPLAPLPDPRLAPGDVAAGLVLVPRFGRRLRRRIDRDHPFELRLLDRDSTEFFLDEDPEAARRRLKLEVPGALAFVAAAGG